MRKHNWLIIYDIADPKRLQKIAKIMEKYSVRVQQSVFEAVAPEYIIEELRVKCRKVMNEQEDYIVSFKLCERDWQKQEKFGCGENSLKEVKNFEIL